VKYYLLFLADQIPVFDDLHKRKLVQVTETEAVVFDIMLPQDNKGKRHKLHYDNGEKLYY